MSRRRTAPQDRLKRYEMDRLLKLPAVHFSLLLDQDLHHWVRSMGGQDWLREVLAHLFEHGRVRLNPSAPEQLGTNLPPALYIQVREYGGGPWLRGVLEALRASGEYVNERHVACPTPLPESTPARSSRS